VRALRRAHRQVALDVQHDPSPGEFGNDTWENDSWRRTATSACGRRSPSIEELGLVYLPVETPTSDYYGGHRPATTCSPKASSASTEDRSAQVALPARAPSAVELRHVVGAILADITVNGRAIKAVAVPASRVPSTCSIA
jgi:quinoprotein glucose dehydrogenase